MGIFSKLFGSGDQEDEQPDGTTGESSDRGASVEKPPVNGSRNDHDRDGVSAERDAAAPARPTRPGTDPAADRERASQLLSPTPKLAGGLTARRTPPQGVTTDAAGARRTPAQGVAVDSRRPPPHGVSTGGRDASGSGPTTTGVPAPMPSQKTEPGVMPAVAGAHSAPVAARVEEPPPQPAPRARTPTKPRTAKGAAAQAAPAAPPRAATAPPTPARQSTPPVGVPTTAAPAAAKGGRPAVVPDEGWSTPDDLAAARQLFDDLAVDHVAQVRDVMLELQLGDVAVSWVESSKPALKSLRSMAQQLEQQDLVGALDAFCAAVDAAIASGRTQIEESGKAQLQAKYQRLIELIPQAFQLDAERDRREPVIVESLLRQVDGVEQITIDRLSAAGLGRLAVLMRANAGDMAAAAGIRPDVAAAIVHKFRSYREASPSTVAAADAAAEHKALKALVAALNAQHAEFVAAATSWSDESREKKRTQRKQRDHTFLQIKLALARLGARDRLIRLEKLPFQERIADLERYLAEVSSRPRTQGG